MASASKLKIDFEFDSILIGLSSNYEDYRLCWQLNQDLNWELIRTENLPSIQPKKNFGLFELQESMTGHVMFSHIDDDNFIDNYLISNFSDTGYLIPEYKQCNYFLLMRGDSANQEEVNSVLRIIQNIELVNSVFIIDFNSIKDIQALMF
jgi:hypothetical protein